MNSTLRTWRANILILIVIFFLFRLLQLILSRCRVTLVRAIRCHFRVLYFKRVVADIIFLDTEAPSSAKKFINTELVQVLLSADH